MAEAFEYPKGRVAKLYRKLTASHKCPFGMKSYDLLKKKGYAVEDHILGSDEAAEAFKKEHGVETTPQAFIDGERVGGYDDLRAYLGLERQQKSDKTTYKPVIYLFSLALIVAAALIFGGAYMFTWENLIRTFFGVSMCFLALLKLQDLFSFTNRFLGYDLLAQRYVSYAYVYPFAEAFAGIGMFVPFLIPVAAPVALFIGTIGAISVIKAVYIDKRDLKCACVGGSQNVPLGFLSLTENLMMVAMGLWMFGRFFGLA